MQGVPKNIRIDCDERFNNSDGERDRHQFLTFSNYAAIVQHRDIHGDNWDEFRDYYSFPERGKRAKKDQIAWVQRLIIARNITHHVEKGPLSKAQVAYVREIRRLVKAHIKGQEKIVPGQVFIEAVEGADGVSEAAAEAAE
jgi:hypothetical protein